MESNLTVDSVTQLEVEVLKRRVDRHLEAIKSRAHEIKSYAPDEADSPDYVPIRAAQLESAEHALLVAKEELVAASVLAQLASAQTAYREALYVEASTSSLTEPIGVLSANTPSAHRLAALSVYEGVPLGSAEHEREVAINWTETAARHSANEDYWRGRAKAAEQKLALLERA